MATRFKNGRLEAVILDYGMRLTSLEFDTGPEDCQQLVRGGWSLAEYEADESYHGAVVGRTCNRIRDGRLEINGQNFQLDCNEGAHHLHGGFSGLHNRVWDFELQNQSLRFSTTLFDGESGYPGQVQVRVTVSIENNTLIYEYAGGSDADTLLDLTNHAYFSLDDTDTIENHLLRVASDYFAPVDSGMIPLGELCAVKNSPFDLNDLCTIGTALAQDHDQLGLAKGFDHSWLLKHDDDAVVELKSTVSGISMKVFTSCPAVQVYSGNYLEAPHSAICLETQHMPDACHHKVFSAPWLKGGETYRSITRYQFRSERDAEGST